MKKLLAFLCLLASVLGDDAADSTIANLTGTATVADTWKTVFENPGVLDYSITWNGLTNLILAGVANQSFATTAAYNATNGFPWGVLYDPRGAGVTAAFNATNGWPWLAVGGSVTLSQLQGATNTITLNAQGVGTTAAYNSTNGFPWGVLYDPIGAALTAAQNATNDLNTALVARITNATNDLSGVTATKIQNATNDLNTGLSAKITSATNDLNTGLSAKITNATNDLNTGLSAKLLPEAPVDGNLYGRKNAGWSLVPAADITDATNDLNTAIVARITTATNTTSTQLLGTIVAATNDLNSALSAKITGATNQVSGNLLSTITAATNDLNTGLSTKITSATNDLNTALVTKINNSTNTLVASQLVGLLPVASIPLSPGTNMTFTTNGSLVEVDWNDSPQDGNFYGRHNGAWAILPLVSTYTFYLMPTNSTSPATDLAAVVPTYPTRTANNYAGLSAGSVVLTNYITPAGTPGVSFLPAGTYLMHMHAAQTGGTKTTQIYAQFVEVNASGTDVGVIGTSETSSALVGSETEYTLIFANDDVYTLASTSSRLVCRVWVTVSGGGSAPTVTLYMGGEADSHMALPSPNIDTSTFVPSSRNINTTAPLSGGGNLGSDLTLALTPPGAMLTNGNSFVATMSNNLTVAFGYTVNASGVNLTNLNWTNSISWTNSASQSVDMNLKEADFSTNATFTWVGLINKSPTNYQSVVRTVQNTSGSIIAILAPANCHTNGAMPYVCTNGGITKVLIEYHPTFLYTNMLCFPLY